MKIDLKIALSLVILLFFALGIIQISFVSAQAYNFSDNSGISQTGDTAGYNDENFALRDKSLMEIIGLIIKILLSLIGIIFLFLAIYAGIVWMTSLGNEQRVERAKETLRNAIIGLLIVFVAYALTILVGNLMAGIEPPVQ